MRNLKIIKVLPMFALLIIVIIFLIQLKQDKNSILNINTHIVCAKSICVVNDKYTECIYLKEKIAHVEIKNDNVILTQTNTNCQIKEK